jgi:WD40 repeat protein
VAISGNTAIVGAHGNDDGGSGSGSAYLFDVATGVQLTKLNANDAAADDLFGYSVGISGNTAIVGAYGNDDSGSFSGSAYLFDVTTGLELSKLTASDAAARDGFSFSVGISGNTAIVGAFGDRVAGLDTGSAYLFDVAAGTQISKLTASDAAEDDLFGWSVAISSNRAIVGAWGNDDAGSSSGSAYLYTPEPSSLVLSGLALMFAATLRR